MQKQKAFTLIELLVVIAIIAVLMGILMPALNRVREQARRQSCGTRVRQHALTLNMYADDNNNKMPLPGSSFYWLQDLAVTTVNYMLATGMTREMFYCPSNSAHQKNNDLFWLYTNKSWDSNKKRFTDESNYICSGYCFLLQTSGSQKRAEIVSYSTDGIKKEWISTSMDSRPADREVVIDSILGVPDSSEQYGHDFVEVHGGIYDQSGVYDRTSHLSRNSVPAGGNVAFMDGHAEWRPFDPEIESGAAVPRYGDNPGFFW